MSDQDIQQLESQFPALSGRAFAAARQSVLAAGQSVLQTEGAYLLPPICADFPLPITSPRHPVLIEPSEEDFAALMEMWEEGRREQRETSLQMRLEMALQMLWPS